MDMAQRVTAAEVSSEQIKRFDWFSAIGSFGTIAASKIPNSAMI